MKFEELFIVDPTTEEEICEGITFCFAYKFDDEFLAVKKFGSITKDTQETPSIMNDLYSVSYLQFCENFSVFLSSIFLYRLQNRWVKKYGKNLKLQLKPEKMTILQK